MQKGNGIIIHDSLPNTHFFLYRGKRYPFNFSLLKYSSKFFLENKAELKKMESIRLVDDNLEDNLDIADETIDSFIKYCHRELIQLNNENVAELNYLANKYEVLSLIRDTNEYISNHHQEIALQILLIHQNDAKFNLDIYEDIISDNLNQYIQDEKILNLNFPAIYRILNKHQSKQGNKLISIDFLFKCLDKYGTEASILFENIDFSTIQTKYVNLLLTKYSKIFDFHFINPLLLKSVYDQQNEMALKEIENQSKIKKCQDEMNQNFSQKIIELKKIEDDQNSRIEKLESQMKLKDDEMKKLKNENSNLITQIQKNEEEINSLKKENESFKTRLESIEKLLDKKESDENKKESDENKKESDENENDDIKTFVPSQGHELDGIFKYLTDETGGNIHKNKTINVTSNSIYGSSNVPENLLSADDKSYAPKDGEQHAWVSFDFKNMEIEVSHYSIKSCNYDPGGAHVKNWVIEISDDGNKWTEIDSHSNSSDLNGRSFVKTFDVKPNHFCRYCRFRHTGEYWGIGDWTMNFRSIEFFGRLKMHKD